MHHWEFPIQQKIIPILTCPIAFLFCYTGLRQVTYKDRLAMPYTEAVMLETLRVSINVTTALPHTLAEDLEIEGKVN